MMFYLFACSLLGEEVSFEKTKEISTTKEEPKECIFSDNYFQDMEIKETNIATVFKVQWNSEGKSGVLIDNPEGGEPWYFSSVEKEGYRESTLIGFPQLRHYEFHIQTEIDENLYCSSTYEINTGLISSKLPEITLEKSTIEDGERLFYLTVLNTAESRFAVIISSLGEYVWGYEVPYESVFEGQDWLLQGKILSKIQFSLDGKSVLFNSNGNSYDEIGTLYRVSLDGELEEKIDVLGLHLGFTEVADKNYVGLLYEASEWNENLILTDRLVAFDVEGVNEVVYDSLDSFSLEDPAFQPSNTGVVDWIHINYVSYDKEDDSFLMSIVRLNSVIKITKDDGLIWMLSGNPEFQSSFTAEESLLELVNEPHSITYLGAKQYLIFNRSYPTDPESCSEVVKVQLDEENQSADLLCRVIVITIFPTRDTISIFVK